MNKMKAGAGGRLRRGVSEMEKSREKNLLEGVLGKVENRESQRIASKKYRQIFDL
jgi:hypothetical protein